MRALFEWIEAGRMLVKRRELATLDPAALAALWSAGILREAPPDDAEVSPSDLVRAVRALYGVSWDGLGTPSNLDAPEIFLGTCPDEAGPRDVVLLPRPRAGLGLARFRMRRSLLLVPTARARASVRDEELGPPRFLLVEALEESLAARDGRLVRAGAPPAPTLEPPAPTLEPPAPTLEARAPTAPARPARVPSPAGTLAGARRWNEVRICLVDAGTIRVDLPGRSVRCTPFDLGMAHPRTRRPTRVWEALVELCVGHGTFRARRFGGPEATKKLVSRLRAALLSHFAMTVSPFHRYRTGEGWRARFEARPDLPAEG